MNEPVKIQIQYCAVLREQRGISIEFIQTHHKQAKELYLELKERYGFKLPIENVRIAINNEFKNWDTPLNNSDKIIFIPPVAGG